MKKVLFLFAALLTFTFAANAQKGDKGNPPEKPTPAQMTERMAEELSLTDAQKAQVLELNTEYADYIGGPHHGGPKPPEMKDGQKPPEKTDGQKPEKPADMPELTDEQKAEMEAHKAKHEEYETKLKAILTADQISTMEANRKKHGEGHGPKDSK